jgi:VIT1/CCC1 family predicted Fe2+/Mn2+ transporter
MTATGADHSRDESGMLTPDQVIDSHLHGHEESHRSHRAGWLRAAVLGANDGLLSTASLVIGVAGGGASRSVVVLTGLAGLFAGAFSMAAGEYSSVSSQRDTEAADLEIERKALVEHPEIEMAELAGIYRDRGLPADLAMEVAEKLHAADALTAHARDELGLDPDELARPVQAALTSAGSFVLGAIVPVLCISLFSRDIRIGVTALVTLLALGGLGALAARLGGAPPARAALRLVVLGGLSMAATFAIGNIVGVSV